MYVCLYILALIFYQKLQPSTHEEESQSSIQSPSKASPTRSESTSPLRSRQPSKVRSPAPVDSDVEDTAEDIFDFEESAHTKKLQLAAAAAEAKADEESKTTSENPSVSQRSSTRLDMFAEHVDISSSLNVSVLLVLFLR